MFAKHHYLSHSFNKAADVFLLFINDMLCGFSSALSFVGEKKNTYIEHRTVILPDFQGIGLSKIFRNNVASYYKKNKKNFITTTSSIALINSMKNDVNWKCTRIGRVNKQPPTLKGKSFNKSISIARNTTSWEYIGD